MHICPESSPTAGRNARKENIPVITVFHGAGDRSALQRSEPLFSLGCGPFLFSRKKKWSAENPFLTGTSPNPFLFGRAQTETGSAAKEKGPWESLGQIFSPPGAGERCEKAGSATVRLRRYLLMLSGQIQTPSGRPPQPEYAGAPEGCVSAPKAGNTQGVTPGRRASQ